MLKKKTNVLYLVIFYKSEGNHCKFGNIPDKMMVARFTSTL